MANNANKVGFAPWAKILFGATSNLTGPPRDVQTGQLKSLRPAAGRLHFKATFLRQPVQMR